MSAVEPAAAPQSNGKAASFRNGAEYTKRESLSGAEPSPKLVNKCTPERTNKQASWAHDDAERALDPVETRDAPHNLEAEQALLGAIFIDNETHDRVSGFLEAHHFYDPLHQQIFETISKLIVPFRGLKPSPSGEGQGR